MVSAIFAQTSPAAQNIPYSQDFSGLAYTDTAYPAGLQGWQLSGSPGSSYKTTAPTSDKSLVASSTAATTSGNVHNYDGKIGFLNSSSVDLSIVLALNTTGKQNINFSYDIMTIRNPYDGGTNTRINEATLQYRIGTTGDFTTLTGIEYQNNTTTQTTAVTTPQNLINKSIALPSACENQPVVEIRWVSRQVSGGGSRASFAIDNINVTSGGTSTPSITANPATLTGFNYAVGAGPSTTQTFSVSGSSLTANISIAASTDYEISLTQASGYTTPLTLTQSGGTVAATTIYVRLKAGLAAGNYNSEVITASSTGATNQTVTCSGSVSSTTPTIAVNPATLTGFTYVTGSGPSATQTFSISGSNLTANISIAATTNYEISLTQASGYTTPLTLTQTGGTVAATTVYVRLKAGLAAGDYNGELITASSTGATNQTVTCSGTVTVPVGPTTFLEENFVYSAGALLTANGWSAHSGGGSNALTVNDGSLSYTGYYALSGNKVTLATSGEDVNHTFTSVNSGSVYVSALINVASSQATGDYLLHLGAGTISTNYRARLFVKQSTATTFKLGVSFAANTGTSVVYAPDDYQNGTTYLVVLKYTVVDGATNDTAKLYINPVIGSTEPTPTVIATDTATDLSDIGSIAIRQGTAANTAVASLDGIRVTNDWALLWAGTPPATPVIQVTGELSPFACYAGSASEETQTYTLNGTDLQGGITITPREGFEVSLTGTDGDWHTTLVASGTFPKTIHVRMNAATAGVYEGNIVHTSPGATTVNLAISGEAFNPSVVWNNPDSLPAFSTVANTPTAAQSYTLSATNATGSLELTTAAPFQISTAATGPWGYSLSLAYNFNASVYVRFNPISAGTFNGSILHNSADASEDAVLLTGTAAPQPGMATDLFLSEYVEGSSNKKAIEIFNGTGAPVDLANYSLKKQTNGVGDFGNELVLNGTLAHNDVYVIVLSSTSGTTLVGEPYVDLATTSSVVSFNGNDCVALYHSGTQIDVVGIVNQATNWGADVTLVRKSSITSPTVSFSFDDWDSYPMDTFTYLGWHLMGNYTALPTFDPPAGPYASTVSVTLSSTTPSAIIRYTTDGSDPTPTTGTVYTTPIPLSTDTNLKAIAYATGFEPSLIASGNYYFPHDVANIAALRTGNLNSNVYRLTGQAVLTFQQASRHQKYIQDATGAIVIDDNAGIITSTYNLYDGVTGITGTLTLYYGLLQFVPIADPGAATSHNNVVTPVVRTLSTITTDDQAKLLKILNVSIDATNVDFGTTAENINVTDASGTIVMRTFPATDYSGTAIPTTPVDIVCLGGEYNSTMQISPRFLADITPATGTLEAPIVSITHSGTYVTLNWAAVAGATTYKIQSSDDPYTGFTDLTNTATTSWTGASEGKMFFRVYAGN